jgi:hypothetical protein
MAVGEWGHWIDDRNRDICETLKNDPEDMSVTWMDDTHADYAVIGFWMYRGGQSCASGKWPSWVQRSAFLVTLQPDSDGHWRVYDSAQIFPGQSAIRPIQAEGACARGYQLGSGCILPPPP